MKALPASSMRLIKAYQKMIRAGLSQAVIIDGSARGLLKNIGYVRADPDSMLDTGLPIEAIAATAALFAYDVALAMMEEDEPPPMGAHFSCPE